MSSCPSPLRTCLPLCVSTFSFILTPVHPSSDIQIKYAVANKLEIAIRGGGHSTSGASSSEDLVIDLSAYMNTVSVDVEKRLLHVGGGAIWADVDAAGAKHGLATVGGTVNHTGTLA
jgi:FAD/FMN-containing dehydrogenase